jgi:hypothetical protein
LPPTSLAIVVPVALYNTVFTSVIPQRDRDDEDFTTGDFFAARFISFGLFLAITAFFLIPLAIWKYIGQQRANVLARRWIAEDSRGTRYNGYVPLWQIRLPGVMSNSTVCPNIRIVRSSIP